ncbi:hypothetical protein ACG9HX_15440 [Acinetobacter ursingii]|uniref:Lipoprotein n=1 Tax=Acinetobacter ursingii TaxID=108980 RepID=A0AA46S2V7_9GAMM|nr:hypothetical protein [Acinetobacter ursingii]UYF70947.1 hypothetical protein LSO60_11835 [Acinetobacter ursingii]
MKKTITVLCMLWGLVGCRVEDNAPVNVYRDYEMNPAYSYENQNVPFSLSTLRVQATTDQITIHNISVNRGQCPVSYWIQGNPDLKFGQEIKGVLRCDSSQVLQVDVVTDQGEYSFSF